MTDFSQAANHIYSAAMHAIEEYYCDMPEKDKNKLLRDIMHYFCVDNQENFHLILTYSEQSRRGMNSYFEGVTERILGSGDDEISR